MRIVDNADPFGFAQGKLFDSRYALAQDDIIDGLGCAIPPLSLDHPTDESLSVGAPGSASRMGHPKL